MRAVIQRVFYAGMWKLWPYIQWSTLHGTTAVPLASIASLYAQTHSNASDRFQEEGCYGYSLVFRYSSSVHNRRADDFFSVRKQLLVTIRLLLCGEAHSLHSRNLRHFASASRTNAQD